MLSKYDLKKNNCIQGVNFKEKEKKLEVPQINFSVFIPILRIIAG